MCQCYVDGQDLLGGQGLDHHHDVKVCPWCGVGLLRVSSYVAA